MSTAEVMSEKSKLILETFHNFIIPVSKYSKLSKEDIVLFTQYFKDYEEVFPYYEKARIKLDTLEKSYGKLIVDKTLPLLKNAFGYSNLTSKAIDGAFDFNENLIMVVYEYLEKKYSIPMTEKRKVAIKNLIGDKYRKWDNPTNVTLTLDMLYEEFEGDLAGQTFKEISEKKHERDFRSGIRKYSRYDSALKESIYDDALKLICEDNKITYQAESSVASNGDSRFKGNHQLRELAHGLSKYEYGKWEIAECYERLTKDTYPIYLKVETDFKGSDYVKRIEVWMRGKVIFTFATPQLARGFLEFCKEY